MTVTAFVGISGAGKTYLLTKICAMSQAVSVSASQLIRDARNANHDANQGSEIARLANTEDMQTVLVAAMREFRSEHSGIVVLDAHVVIDKDTRLDRIAPEVFNDLGVSRIVHLVVEPELIAERRGRDMGRSRPVRSLSELEIQQNISRDHARHVAKTIGVDYLEVDGGEPELIRLVIPD